MDTTQTSSSKKNLTERLKNELQTGRLAKNLNAAILVYLLEAILMISFAALVFSGPLSGRISIAIGFLLAGDALLIMVVSLLSSYGGSISAGQDAPAVIMALAAASIVDGIPAGANEAQAFSTILVMMVGSASLMGLLFLLMGTFKLGRFVRFLPYPVMGGFLAGTGWLLVEGGIGVMTNAPFDMGMFEKGILILWLPGLLLAGLVLAASSYFKSAWVLPLCFAVVLAIFYGLTLLLQIPLETLFAGSWLLGPFPAGTAWRFPTDAQTLSAVDWQALASAIPVVAPVLLISLLACLLNVSSLELVIKRDIDVNRELMAIGIANLAAGLAGGLIGYHTISLSALNHTISKGSRLPGVLASLMLALTIVVGVPLLSYIPRFLVGGLVVYIGMALLYDWIYRVWFTFPKIDVLIIYSILAIIVSTNFLWGILAGMVMTVVMFVVSYSKINIVKYSLTGKTKRSRFTRPRAQAELFWTLGDQLSLYKLQGFIFFGTAYDLYVQIQRRVHSKADARLRYILMDFALVPGLDSTGLLYFKKLLQLTQEQGVILIFTGRNERVNDQFRRGGFDEQTPGLRFFADMDHGMEWYEEQVVAEAKLERSGQESLLDCLMAVVPEEPHFNRLIQSMQRREVNPGEYLMHQGDDSDELFFIESGQVTAQIENDEKEKIRLETMTGGRIVGEVGFYLNVKRTASVIVDQPGVIYSLTRVSLENIKKTDPQAVYALQNYIVRLLGERVAHLTRAVEDLQG